nr:MAG TPA: hypothetical protein [Bacteriophage sp.]
MGTFNIKYFYRTIRFNYYIIYMSSNIFISSY